MIESIIENNLNFYQKSDDHGNTHIDYEGLINFGRDEFDFDPETLKELQGKDLDTIKNKFRELAKAKYEEKEKDFGDKY